MIGVFFPIDRRHMRRIFTEIRSSDAKLRMQREHLIDQYVFRR